jgi:hypothetical protein
MTRDTPGPKKVVYYESIKRELKIKPIYECRCDGRLHTGSFTYWSRRRLKKVPVVYYESIKREPKKKSFIIITGKARAKENTYKWVSV